MAVRSRLIKAVFFLREESRELPTANRSGVGREHEGAQGGGGGAVMHLSHHPKLSRLARAGRLKNCQPKQAARKEMGGCSTLSCAIHGGSRNRCENAVSRGRMTLHPGAGVRAKGCIVPSNGTAVGQDEPASVRPSESAVRAGECRGQRCRSRSADCWACVGGARAGP